MAPSGYKILGFVVWRGARWYVRRNYGQYLPSRRTAGLALGLTVGVTAAAVRAGRRGSD